MEPFQLYPDVTLSIRNSNSFSMLNWYTFIWPWLVCFHTTIDKRGNLRGKGCIYSYNDKIRDGLLNGEIFTTFL